MPRETWVTGLFGALFLIWCVGILDRGYWTPDEPREADIAWRMSWQVDKAVPLLAGEPFCEKPPLTYWAAAIPISLFGPAAWAARLPQLLYALITALATGALARRAAGRFAGFVAAAAVSTFLLSYQVAIWLATDAPLLAAVAVSLLGAYSGFYASSRPERLRGYLLMHVALAVGFLSKSAVAWMVPALAIVTLSLWERRWRELFRWELYAGVAIQAVIVLTWVWYVYSGPDGPDHLKVFFWNNLVGRFTAVDAPAQIQYAAGHRNTPGKYLVELPMYLFPWTLVMLAAVRRAWRQRRSLNEQDARAIRFALACTLPTLLVLSLAATARNIYLAPALPGAALLLAWWARETLPSTDTWDVRALRATAVIMLIGVLCFAAALTLVALDSWPTLSRGSYIVISAGGLLATTASAVQAWQTARSNPQRSQAALFVAYCVLLIAPASQLYHQVDRWQDLSKVSRAIQLDAGPGPLVMLLPDETTVAAIDLYRPDANLQRLTPLVAGDVQTALELSGVDGSILIQLPKLTPSILQRFRTNASASLEGPLAWITAAHLHIWKYYSVANGRRYALLKPV